MIATIKAIDPEGVAVDFTTGDMKIRELIPLLPQIKGELIRSGFTLVDSQPAQPVPESPVFPPTFSVERITATVDDGKVYWRAKGGEFQKFGVVIYPEVLTVAGLDELNPLESFECAGQWVAHYALKENGKPKKVIKLEARA